MSPINAQAYQFSPGFIAVPETWSAATTLSPASPPALRFSTADLCPAY